MKYEVRFQFKNSLGEWKDDYLNNNGKGFTMEEAEAVALDLVNTSVVITRNVHIVKLNEEG